MQPDVELETWRRQWQAQEAVPLDLTRRVEREIRTARIGVVVAIVVTAAFGVGVPAWALMSRRGDVAVLAVGVWIFLGINWFVSFRLGRGASRPLADTASAFLDFSILSHQRRHRAIAAAAVLYASLLTFVLAWKYHEVVQATPLGLWAFLTLPGILVVWGISGLLAAAGLWRRRELRRELRTLLALRQQLETTAPERRPPSPEP